MPGFHLFGSLKQGLLHSTLTWSVAKGNLELLILLVLSSTRSTSLHPHTVYSGLAFGPWALCVQTVRLSHTPYCADGVEAALVYIIKKPVTLLWKSTHSVDYTAHRYLLGI